ncbi:MAG TPA: M1 family aminopeptidase [Polyangiaceae bacterium]|nr:M1 family aminopeptidase [Polyangiaceae bacterium]
MALVPGDILDTTLSIDLEAHTGIATLTLAPSEAREQLEVGDLVIRSVQVDDGHGGKTPLDSTREGTRLEFTLPASTAPLQVTFEYDWQLHERHDGISANGQIYTWPYWCGNVFPCRSAPGGGSTFHLTLAGNDAPTLHPREIASDAPPYMLAWTSGWQRKVELGTTRAGTRVSLWRDGADASAAQAGSAHLVAAFDWLERNIGPYRFGADVASVVVDRSILPAGGIELHPYWQVSSREADDESLHIHEAAHGWFGNGVRLRCWEDFVLSEGTASYLAARVLEEVAGSEAAASVWQTYRNELGTPGVLYWIAWPDSCGQIDILDEELRMTSRIPYVKGALFYRALEQRIGRDLFDQGLRTFYQRWAGKAAGMQDLLDVMQEVSGYTVQDCAVAWLRREAAPPEACP